MHVLPDVPGSFLPDLLPCRTVPRLIELVLSAFVRKRPARHPGLSRRIARRVCDSRRNGVAFPCNRTALAFAEVTVFSDAGRLDPHMRPAKLPGAGKCLRGRIFRRRK